MSHVCVRDIERMTGVRPGMYWQIMWRFVSPLLMFVVIVSSVYFMLKHKPTYTAWDANLANGVKKEYPDWALAAAVILAVSSLVPVFGGAAFWVAKRYKTFHSWRMKLQFLSFKDDLWK